MSVAYTQMQQMHQNGKAVVDVYANNANINVNGDVNVENTQVVSDEDIGAQYAGLSIQTKTMIMASPKQLLETFVVGAGAELEQTENYEPGVIGTLFGTFYPQDARYGFKWFYILVWGFTFASLLTFLALSIACWVGDNGLYYRTKFDFATDFSTHPLIGPQLVVEYPSGQQNHFRVAVLLFLTFLLPTIVMLASFLYTAYRMWAAASTVGQSIDLWTITRAYFNAPVEHESDELTEMMDLVSTPLVWLGVFLAFGARIEPFALLVVYYGLARGGAAWISEIQSVYTDKNAHAARQLAKQPFAYGLGIARRFRQHNLLLVAFITVSAWTIFLWYLGKYPSDPRPNSLIALAVVLIFFEVVRHILMPGLYHTISLAWMVNPYIIDGNVVMIGHKTVIRKWDRYTFNGFRMLCFILALITFFVILRWGDNPDSDSHGYEWMPRWGFPWP